MITRSISWLTHGRIFVSYFV